MLDITLSDLFFNHDHPEYNELYRNLEDKRTLRHSKSLQLEKNEIKEAVLKDANAFYEAFTEICQMYSCGSPEELAEDFLSRI